VKLYAAILVAGSGAYLIALYFMRGGAWRFVFGASFLLIFTILRWRSVKDSGK
jgi:hypothetical protein